MLTTVVENDLIDSGEDYTSADVESKIKQYLEVQCIQPIEKYTKETNIPHIAVSRGSTVLSKVLL